MLTPEQERLVAENLRVVDRVVEWAFKSRPETATYTREDARQEGYVALLAAAGSYRRDGGASFPTYAGRRVFGAILDGFRRLDPLTRGERQAVRAAGGGTAQVRRKSGELVDVCHPVTLSLEEPVPGSTMTHGDLLAGVGDDDDDRADLRRIVRPLIRKLPAREAYVIWRIFFEDARPVDVGAELDLHPSRISQLVAAAERRLRGQLALEAA